MQHKSFYAVDLRAKEDQYAIFLARTSVIFPKRDMIIVLVLNSMPHFFYCFCILWFAVGLDESTNHVEALWTMT